MDTHLTINKLRYLFQPFLQILKILIPLYYAFMLVRMFVSHVGLTNSSFAWVLISFPMVDAIQLGAGSLGSLPCVEGYTSCFSLLHIL